MVDYSRFNNIQVSDSEDEADGNPTSELQQFRKTVFNGSEYLNRNPDLDVSDNAKFTPYVLAPGQGRKTKDITDIAGPVGGGIAVVDQRIGGGGGGGGGGAIDPNLIHGNPGSSHPMPKVPDIPSKPVPTAANSVPLSSSNGARSNPGFQIKQEAAAELESQPTDKQKMTKRDKKTGRLQFEYEGRVIYEWEQTLDDVSIYIRPPQGITRQMLNIKIAHKRLTVGLQGAPPFVEEPTGGPVKADESTWMLADGEITIILQKMNKAELWECALAGKTGQTVDQFTKEEMKKKLMLDRFQEEHPGFDFSGAEFNGEVPSAREFMGGVRRS